MSSPDGAHAGAISFLGLVVKEGALAVDFEDEIVRDTCVAHGGKVTKEAPA